MLYYKHRHTVFLKALIKCTRIELVINNYRYLEVAAVAPPERQDESLEDQFSNLRELGVEDGDKGSVNMSKDW